MTLTKFKIFGKEKEKPMLTEGNIEREREREREREKPLWFKLNKKDFEELTEHIYHNQDGNNF